MGVTFLLRLTMYNDLHNVSTTGWQTLESNTYLSGSRSTNNFPPKTHMSTPGSKLPYLIRNITLTLNSQVFLSHRAVHTAHVDSASQRFPHPRAFTPSAIYVLRPGAWLLLSLIQLWHTLLFWGQRSSQVRLWLKHVTKNSWMPRRRKARENPERSRCVSVVSFWTHVRRLFYRLPFNPK